MPGAVLPGDIPLVFSMCKGSRKTPCVDLTLRFSCYLQAGLFALFALVTTESIVGLLLCLYTTTECITSKEDQQLINNRIGNFENLNYYTIVRRCVLHN